jgi:NADH-quinone oxidoreductase subunit G
VSTVKITVNGRVLEVPAGSSLIRACHDHRVDVPMYCYHPGLTPVGSCRICQVEVRQGEQPPRVVVACRTPVAEGMVVDTEAPAAHETRRQCLEFLLKNHPLDCPICDKAGECDLQDYAFAEGQGKGRTREPRRTLEKRVDLGDVIVLDQERCILCSRCVRFFEEVTKKPQLTVAGLGSRSVITTFAGRPLTGNYQGNVADICPVGALTLKPFRFQARVWNLSKTPSTCAECSRGCAVSVEVLRRTEVKRFRPRYDAAVNGWWMCDVGRFAFGHVNAPPMRPGEPLSGRLAGGARRGPKGLEAAGTEEALAHAADLLARRRPPLVIASPFLTQEEAQALLAAARRLDPRATAEPAFVAPLPNGLADELLHTGDPCPNRRGLAELGLRPLAPAEALAELAAAEAALLVGERVAELLGLEPLAALPAGLRLVLFDTHARDFPAVDAAIGVSTHVEKSGHWLNIDGVRRDLRRAKAPPAGVAPLERALARLAELAAGPAQPGADAGAAPAGREQTGARA